MILTPDQAYQNNQQSKGFIKIWRSDKKTGASELLVEKPNTILYGGADLLAYALAGQTDAKISHFYVGYSNTVNFEGPNFVVEKDEPAFVIGGGYGYLRVPLTFPPSFLTTTNYQHNTPIFTILLSDPDSYKVGLSPTFSGASSLFEIGLVAALNDDVVFSRAQFAPILYDSAHNLTISWGVRFES